MRLTLRHHPVELLRPQMGRAVHAGDLRDIPDGTWVEVVGLVITRQRPGTASGVIFLTLEDETGASNVIVWPKTFAKNRKVVMSGRLLKIHGKLQREGIVTHIVSTKIEDYSHLLDTMGDVESAGGAIDPTYSSADEVKRPVPVKEGGPAGQQRPALRTPRVSYGSGARHPREQAKKLFYSRDFH